MPGLKDSLFIEETALNKVQNQGSFGQQLGISRTCEQLGLRKTLEGVFNQLED